MEITPELIADYEFSTSIRGFDVDEVNDFLEKVGTELARVQHQLRRSTERVSALEAELQQAHGQLAAPSGAAEADASRAARALIAAQETADRIEAESRQAAAATAEKANTDAESTRAMALADAARMRKAASDDVTRLRAECDEEVQRLKEEAVTEAENLKEGRLNELDDQIASLTSLSSDLQADVAALETRSDHYRSLLETIVTKVREVLDDEDALYDQPPLELKVKVPSTPRVTNPGEAPVEQPAEGWAPGTWSQSLAEAEPGFEDEDDDVVDESYPMGAETTDVAVVTIDHDEEYDDGIDLEEPAPEAGETAEPWFDEDSATGAHDIAVSDSDRTLNEWEVPEVPPAPAATDDYADTVAPVAESGYSTNPFADPGYAEDDYVEPGYDGHDAAGVDAAPDAEEAHIGEYTAEYSAVDMSSVAPEAPQAAAGGVQQQLQAFAGDVDAFQTNPYVPNQVFVEDPAAMDDDGVGLDFTSQVDLAVPQGSDDRYGGGYLDEPATSAHPAAAFDEEPAWMSAEPAAPDYPTQAQPSVAFTDDGLSAGDRFEFGGLDHGQDEFGAFENGDAPSAFASPPDRYHQALDEAVNRGDTESDRFDAFIAAAEPEPDQPKRRFRRR